MKSLQAIVICSATVLLVTGVSQVSNQVLSNQPLTPGQVGTTCILGPPIASNGAPIVSNGQAQNLLQSPSQGKVNQQSPYNSNVQQPQAVFVPQISQTATPIDNLYVDTVNPTTNNPFFPSSPGYQYNQVNEQQKGRTGQGRSASSGVQQGTGYNNQNQPQQPVSGVQQQPIAPVFFNDQPSLYNPGPIQGGPGQNRPQTPVYDRSGFRREPLHPSFAGRPLTPVGASLGASSAPQTVPGSSGLDGRGPVTAKDGSVSGGNTRTWNTFNTAQQQSDGTKTSPTPSYSNEGNSYTNSYFDPTRRPKGANPRPPASPGSRKSGQHLDGGKTTSQRPYFFSPLTTTTPSPVTQIGQTFNRGQNPNRFNQGQNVNNQGQKNRSSIGGQDRSSIGGQDRSSIGGQDRTSIGGQDRSSIGGQNIPDNRNNPFARNRTGVEADIRDKSVLGPNDPSISDPDVQTVPEYAYVKQPINKVLDQPDLELDGKQVKFTIMKDALYRVGLLELVSGPGPVTLFTPSDDAFLSLPSETLSRLQQNPAFLRTTMLRHIVNFDVPPHLLKNNIVIPTYSGEPLIINVLNKGKLMLVRGVPIVAATNTENGVIYVVNKVLTEETSSGSVLEEIQLRPELSTFYNYLQRTPLISKLQGQGPFTILAPNNSAFEELSPVTRQVLEYNPSALEKLLSSHVVEGAVYSKELEGRESLPLKDGEREESIKIESAPDGKLTINEGPIVTVSDISTGNGVIHLLNGILFPPNLLLTFKQLEARTFFNRQPIMAEGRFSENRNPESWNSENRFNRRATNSPVANDLRGNANNQRNSQLAIRGIPGQIRPLLDDPMKPGQKLEATNTTRFYRWLQKSGFMDVLNNTRSNYTIVLPTDKAVNRLPLKYQTTLEQSSKQLESLLMYHIIPGSVNMSRLKDEDTIPTVSGKDIRFNKYQSKYQSKEVKVSNQGDQNQNRPNQVARNRAQSGRGQSNRDQRSNSSTSSAPLLTLSGAPIVGMSEIEDGRIQFVIVDRVMYPPQGDLFQIISKSPILRSLTNLVNVANLQTELSVSGPFTLFAPSDQAFNKLTPESIGYLSHDAESSRAFLLRHIVRPIIFTSSVPIGNSSVIENTAGERLEMFREPDRVKIDGVGVMYADITATNGVIHVIDHVL